MLTLSHYRRDRLRALGVEADLPVVTVYFMEGELSMHLSVGCRDVVPASAQRVTALDLKVYPFCYSCNTSSQHGPAYAATTELEELDSLVEAIGMAELTEHSNRSTTVPSPSALGGSLADCRRMLSDHLVRLSERRYTSAAALPLRAQLERVEERIVDLLRTDRGRSEVVSDLVMRRMMLSRDHDSLLVDLKGLEGRYLAAAEAFGIPVGPGRRLVRGSMEAIGVLNISALSVPLSLGDVVPLEVVRTASALWEPSGDGPLSRGDSLLEAARLLTPTSSSNA